MGYHEYFEFDVRINNLTEEEKNWWNFLFSNSLEECDLFCDLDPEHPISTEVEISKQLKIYLKEFQSVLARKEYFFPDFQCQINGSEIHLFPGTSEYSSYQLARVLQKFLFKFRSKDKIAYRWIRFDNRGKGTYNGGAFVVSSDIIESINLKTWIVERLESKP